MSGIKHTTLRFKKLTEEALTELPSVLTAAMYKALNLLGDIAASEFMISGTGDYSEFVEAFYYVHPTKLQWRSGRLGKALIGGGKLAGDSQYPERVTTVSMEGWRFVGGLTINVPYAIRHEFGGTYSITSRQTSMFYARWKSGAPPSESLWKALFFKGRAGGSITTPPRPFLNPALMSDMMLTGTKNIFVHDISMLMDKIAKKMNEARS